MGIIKGFIFDGINSHLYGLGITGKDVYNSAERDVEVIQIPGRNGDLIRDKKRFNNIDITYEAGAFDRNQPDFAQKLADLRNALASRVGYKRLEDEYNIDEYRMGYYKGQFETEPTSYQRAGEFEITFSCLPQRFLKSGENEVAITSGGSIVNPTQFESKPLLMVKGYGNISIGDKIINLDDSVDLGLTTVSPSASNNGFLNLLVPLRPVLDSGDTFNVSATFAFVIEGRLPGEITALTANDSINILSIEGNRASFQIPYTGAFVYGTTSTSVKTTTINITADYQGTVSYYSYNIVTRIAYDASTQALTISNTQKLTDVYYQISGIAKNMNEITAYSTASALGDPTYIDLDIGEAYRIDYGEIVSANKAVSLGGELATLNPGENVVSFDNTITEVKIIPRWWII